MTENEITLLMLRLADMGVRGIKIHYDGGGDSGCIEDVVYTTEEYETPEDINDHVNMWDGSAKTLAELDSSAYSQITDFATEQILDKIEDWWNNEGGFGYMAIQVPSGKYIVNNSVRITETEEYFHDGTLFDKREDV